MNLKSDIQSVLNNMKQIHLKVQCIHNASASARWRLNLLQQTATEKQLEDLDVIEDQLNIIDNATNYRS